MCRSFIMSTGPSVHKPGCCLTIHQTYIHNELPNYVCCHQKPPGVASAEAHPKEGYHLALSCIDTIYSAIGIFIIVVAFLCSVFFTMSQDTATTTTLHVTVVCSISSITIVTVTMAPTSAATTDPKRHNERGCWPHHCATLATSVPDAFLGLCQFYHGSPQMSFSFSKLSLPNISYVSACFSVCFMFSGSNVATIFTNRGSTVGSLNH